MVKTVTNQKRIISCQGNGFGIIKGLALCDLAQESSIIRKIVSDIGAELDRWEQAVSEVKCQIKQQYTAAASHGKANTDEAQILNAHLSILEDPALIDAVIETIRADSCCAEWALFNQAQKISAMLENACNPIIRERALDIRDIVCQLQKRLEANAAEKKGGSEEAGMRNDSPCLDSRYILIKDLLFPSDILQYDSSRFIGIICARGSWTTHSAILAKSKSIPMAILDHPEELQEIEDGSELILDVDQGSLTIHPDEKALLFYSEKVKRQSEDDQLFQKLKSCTLHSGSGGLIRFEANISGPESLPEVIQSEACGIGLFRTEFLYYNHDSLPSEEEQYQIYLQVVKGMNGLPVTFRTFDIGGDKQVPSLKIPHEMNPFLGYRAIRIALAEPELFKTQIRAILRAGAGYPIQIMFPMISTVGELEQAKEIVYSVRDELMNEKVACATQFKLGMMIEIPAAAVLADQFARKCDFFSIGTNDLIQYTMACDRLNEKVQHLYRADDPAVLKLIQIVAEAAHANGIEVAICGEAAANTDLTAKWMELGIDVLSMSPSVLPKVKVSAYKKGLLRID